MTLQHRIDPLAGLFNQEQMKIDLSSVREDGRRGYWALFGIDHMKNINTLQGREGGSALKMLASALNEETPSPKVYRLDSGIFAVPEHDAPKSRCSTSSNA